MATTTDINFVDLVDISLGTPELVNYKGLRVLLLSIVNRLGVGNVNLELNEGDKFELIAARDSSLQAREATKLAKDASKHVKDDGVANQQIVDNVTEKDAVGTARPTTGNVPRKETGLSGGAGGMDKSKSIGDALKLSDDGSYPKVIKDIEDKMSKIEVQLSALNALPSNESLMERSRTSVDGTRQTPVSDMWQLMQCQRKAEANEEGVSKLMSMVQDIMGELQKINKQFGEFKTDITDLRTDLRKEVDKLNEYNKTVETRLSKLETSTGQQDKIDELQKLLDDLRNRLATLPSVEEIVTWPGFEAALKGAYKESPIHADHSMQTTPVTDSARIQTMPTIDAAAQTHTPVPPTPSPPPSRPVSSKSIRSGVSTASIHPTQELQRVLKDIGELTGRHNLLEDRVKGLEELLAKKADMSEVEALLAQWNVPADLAKKLAELEEGLAHLRDSKTKDSESLANLQSALLQLQAEVDKLNSSYIHLVDEHNAKQKHIDALYTFVDRLQENKADKEHVIMEIDVKADKHALDNKVSRSHFEGTVDELSKNLNEVMDKMSGHRVAWDSAVSELKLDIDNKLDRMELDPLKAYLDNRIKSVSAKVVRKEPEITEDAAGFRKPLQKFHCISCDRPLDMAPQAPLASLPESKGLPGNRTGRPYTTFELEQIRAAQKNGNYQDVPDYFVATRSCGGSHTLTYPHRRITRVSQLTNMVTTTEELTPVINGKLEADIQGQDGHIYKARVDPGAIVERLPTLPQPKAVGRAKSPRVNSARGRRSQGGPRQSTEYLDSSMGGLPRPTSARGTGRPTSGRPSSARPQSSLSTGGGRQSPNAPANTAEATSVDNPGTGEAPPPPTPRETNGALPETVTVPQPPQEQT